MNTTAPYKKPTHLNRYGKYESVTYCNRARVGYSYVMLRIALVWFNRMGWYFVVELDANSTESKKYPSIHEPYVERGPWSKGPDLALCAEAAERAAAEMLNKHGFGPLVFNPFELKDEDKPFDRAAFNLDMDTK